jgi:carbon storage regulator
MLVLTRHRHESIRIGDEIVITVCEIDIRRGLVRLGINAPPAIPVHRQEVYERIRAERFGEV